VVSFTLQLLYPQRKNPFYSLDRRMGGPQSWSVHNSEEKINIAVLNANVGFEVHMMMMMMMIQVTVM
jgi:hypothetical protein